MQDRREEIVPLKKKILRQSEIIEEQEEKIRDLRQLAANQDAEITALRTKLVGVSEVLDDLISSEVKSRELLEDCREVLVKMQAAVDAM